MSDTEGSGKHRPPPPKYLQYGHSYASTLADVREVAKGSASEQEWEEYERWMRDVCEFPHLVLSRELKGKPEVSVRMSVWLLFYRLELPVELIHRDHIREEEKWIKEGRTPWSFASSVTVPVVALGSQGLEMRVPHSSTWWLKPRHFRVNLARDRVPVAKLVHRVQTTAGTEGEWARPAEEMEHDACNKAVLRWYGRDTGRVALDELKGGATAYESEAIERFASKMHIDGSNGSTSQSDGMAMSDGWLKRKTKTGWRRFYYVVSGGDNVPGMLSEFKSDDVSAEARNTIFLESCTAFETKLIGSQPTKPNTFELSRRNKDSVYFRASSDEEMKKWIGVLAGYSNVINVDMDLSVLGMAGLTASEKGKIDNINLPFTKLLGYNRTEVIGKNVRVLMLPSVAKEHSKYLAAYSKKPSGSSNIIGVPRDLEVVVKGGEVVVMTVTVGEFVSKNKRWLFATFSLPSDDDADEGEGEGTRACTSSGAAVNARASEDFLQYSSSDSGDERKRSATISLGRQRSENMPKIPDSSDSTQESEVPPR